MFKRFFTSHGVGISTDRAKINDVLHRGVEEIFVKENLEKRLQSGKPLRIKLGIDPTGGNIHLGHAIVLWKLRAFQELGHQIILIVGDFTAKIGDPSDKLEKRPILTDEQIALNLVGYKKQLGKILDLNKTELRYNSAWLSKLRFDEICILAESFSVQQMTNRRNFKDRIDKGIEISVREFMYPLMQGYDSVAISADIELGGFDQLFNLKAGRVIQKHYGQPEQDFIVCKMLVGTDGRKMSKSWGNVINIMDTPDDMFGKTMALHDDLMKDYFLLCTDTRIEDVEKIDVRITGGENPRDIKLELAEKIVARYWDKKEAERARTAFISTFSEKKIPDNVEIIKVIPGSILIDAILLRGIVKSKNEWRRLVSGGAVTDAVSGVVMTDPNMIAKDGTYKIGKRRFIKIIF